MTTHNFILFVVIFGLAAKCTLTCDKSETFGCNDGLSKFLQSQIYKEREAETAADDCGENEVYHIAGVTNYCRHGCKTGCYCKPGYIFLDEEDGCVRLEDTKMICNKTEVVTCGKSSCQEFYDLTQDPLCDLNFFDCKYSYNCFCKEGYVRIYNETCVPKAKVHKVLYQIPLTPERLPEFSPRKQKEDEE